MTRPVNGPTTGPSSTLREHGNKLYTSSYDYHHGQLELKVFEKEKGDGEDVIVHAAVAGSRARDAAAEPVGAHGAQEGAPHREGLVHLR